MGNTESETAGNTVIALIDDRECLRDALCGTIGESLDITVCALDSVKDLDGVVFLDMLSPLVMYCSGAKCLTTVQNDIAEIKSRVDLVRVALIVDNYNNEELLLARSFGASGLIPSTYSSTQLNACIMALITGVAYFPEVIMGYVKPNAGSATLDPAAHGCLTPRQLQIMEHLTVGRSNKYIASELGLCENTVKVHVHDAMKRLGATSRTHASYLLNSRVANTAH